MSNSSRPTGPATGAPSGVEPLVGLKATIDLGALARNWAHLASIAMPARCGATVKADGYGLGLEHVAQTLIAAGCDTFFVALPIEGVRLRRFAHEATIYVMNGTLGAQAGHFVRNRLIPFLHSRAAVSDWEAEARRLGQRLPAALNVDTGMNRLGLSVAETEALADAEPPGIDIKLLATHFACADQPDHPLNQRQRERFEDLRWLFPNVPASLANSAAMLNIPEAVSDLVRPGIVLYGASPGGEQPALETVVTLEARVIQVRDVPAGETVGYGADWTARRPSRIAICSAGYADGLLRAAGASDERAGATVFAAGRRCPLAGRISMDLLAVDVTDTAPDAVHEGAWVEIFGPNARIDAFAAAAGTIPYELLTGLSHRAARHYVGGPAPAEESE